jgi:hypothetical protein
MVDRLDRGQICQSACRSAHIPEYALSRSPLCCWPSSPSLSRAIWPSTRAGWGHAILSGVLLHGLYLGGVWWAISQGVPSSVSGLIAALQPLLTAVAAPFIVGERLTASQKLGVLLGFAGLAVAIAATTAGARSSHAADRPVPLAHQCFCHGVGNGGHDLPEALSAGRRPARHCFAAICRRLSCGCPAGTC